MEPIRPYKIFYKTFQPVNRQIFDEITQRMLLVLKYYKRNCWDIRDIAQFTEKVAVQKIHIDNGSEGIVSHPQVIEFQTVYSNERRTIECGLETKNIPGVPDGRHEVFYIADTDEFIYRRDPKVSDYMNMIFIPSVVDILYKDIQIIVSTLRWHHDSYVHTHEVQKRKMEHKETEDDKCDAAWRRELLHLSESLRQMNTEHTGVRYETILFDRGKKIPPILLAFVVHLPNDVLHGVIAIIANLNDDTALELRYYETCSGLLSTDDRTTVMSIAHTGVVRSGLVEAYRKLCANVGKEHCDKIIGMVKETTGDPIKQKEEVMETKNKWVAALEDIHSKVKGFVVTAPFIIRTNMQMLGDDEATLTVKLHEKEDEEHFGEIRYTTNETYRYMTPAGKRRAGLAIRYFSNRQDVHWCEPLSIVDMHNGLYIVRDEPTTMLKDLGAEWTAKFIGLLRDAAIDHQVQETSEHDEKEEAAVSEKTHTIELCGVKIEKAELPIGCDARNHITLKIWSNDDEDHEQIFKMYEDCKLTIPRDNERRFMPSRSDDVTKVVVFVEDAESVDVEKVSGYYCNITLTLQSQLVPGNTLINAEVRRINVPSVGRWNGLPTKEHESDEEATKPAEDKPKIDDKWIRFVEDMARMFKRQNDKPRFKHMKFEPKLAHCGVNRLPELDVKCSINNDRIGMFTVRMNNRPSGSEERVPVVIRFFPECNVLFCEGIYWIDGCKHAALHINKQTGGCRSFYDDMVRTVGIKFVQFFEMWLKNKLECINASDCEEDIEDVDEDTTDGVETVVLHNVSYRVIKHVEPIFTIANIFGLKDDEADRLMQLYEKCPGNITEKFCHAKGFDPSAMKPKRLMRGIVQIPVVCYGSIAGVKLDTVGLGITRATKMKIRHDQERYIPELYVADISIADDSQVSCDKPKEVEDMKAEQPKFESRITHPREFTLRDVAVRVPEHSACANPMFVEFAPISELEKEEILDMYSSNPLDGEEAKRNRIDPQFWQIRGTNTFGVRLSVFFISSDMLQRLEATRPYERFDVKLSLSRGQINITVESLTFKKMIHSSLELFESHTATELTKRAKRLAANSTYGMLTRPFDECIEEAARYVQAIYPESDTAKKLTESIQAISANPGETIWIDSLGCKNKTKNSGGTTMRGTSISIEKLFFNGSTTIVMWTDGTKTVVQPTEGEKFDPEIGIAMAIARKLFGSRHQFDKFVDEKVSDLAIRNAKAFTEKELATAIVENSAVIAAAKKKHAADKEAYNAAKAAGEKKLPVLSGLKSDRRYRYAKIMIDAFTAEQAERKRKKAARAASAKKTTKKPSTKKPSTKKSDE